MSTLEVISPGLLTTVQDLGRYGYGPLGISPSGAADPLSLRIGNRLAGNPENAAALEMTLLGGVFRFPEGAVIAVSGGDFAAAVDGAAAEMWCSLRLRPGATLSFGAARSGARCYLCVRGGIQVRPFLGSASTHLLSGLGGLQGRALRAGDVLAIGAAAPEFRRRRLDPRCLATVAPGRVLRVTPGPQSDWFGIAAAAAFYSGAWRVSEQCDRMGLRLAGEPVSVPARREMITEGVSLGAIQIPANGQPIILFVEQQTTGGYPKIANVISADMWRLGQLRPRDEIHFEKVDWETARRILRQQESEIASDTLMVE